MAVRASFCPLIFFTTLPTSGLWSSGTRPAAGGGKAVIDDLGAFAVPVVLFSGGEPLLRPGLFDLIGYAQEKGIRAVLSTNGTLITPALARDMTRLGLSYVGISIDGPAAVRD